MTPERNGPAAGGAASRAGDPVCTGQHPDTTARAAALVDLADIQLARSVARLYRLGGVLVDDGDG